ncbi:ATP-binding protein [uncultured Maribacter sp.]|uniref:ATP-binding protein n=1 Tax=uncultured Maribacter sp. TaxID=431308 RepID=UPI0030EB4372|tara:strand:+ start:73039 stop:75105 length:2067 start_codon:yes stop_codon:yes gene_type:complete
MRNKFSTGSTLLALIVFFMSLICSLNLSAQSEKKNLAKIKELKSKQDFNPESPVYIDLLIELSNNLLYTNKDSTLLLVNEGLALSLKTNYIKGEGFAYLRLGDYYARMADKENYKYYYNKAIALSKDNDFKKLEGYVLNNYGNILSETGDYNGALRFYLEGIELGKVINEPKFLGFLYDNIGVIYNKLNDYETSLIFHKKAYTINKEIGDKFLIASTLSTMASVYANMHNFNEAYDALSIAIPIFTEEESLDWLSFCYEVKGIIALEQKNYENALKWYLESNKICENLNYFTGTLNTYSGLADAYLGLGQIDSAEHYALRAHKEALPINFSEVLKKTTRTLSSINRVNGDYKIALEYQDDYLKLIAEVDSENFKKSMSMLRSHQEYEVQKNLLLEKKNKEIANQQTFTFIALCGLFVLIVFLILIYRDYKIQGKFNTSLQKNQQVLKQRELELNESNNTKDKLFSLIAHDLRGPINSFYGIMELYVDGQMSKEQSDQFLPVALEDLRSITDMLDNLLVWGQTQISGITHNPKNINIQVLVQENIRLLRPLAIKKGITITNKLNEETISYSDNSHINIVLRNLLSNSIKFTNAKGNITISAIEKDSKVQISIVDDGIGMDSQTTNNIFKENNYKSTYGTNNEKGTGLGLSICQEMVEKNGGQIWVESTLNKGTTFYFTLPSKKILKKII